MDLAIGIFAHFLVLGAAGLLAYLLQKQLKSKPWKYSLTSIFIIASFFIVWNVDFEIPLNQSQIRDSGASLNYLLAASLSLLKYFGLCMVIFSINREKSNG